MNNSYSKLSRLIDELLQLNTTKRYPYIVEELEGLQETIREKEYYIAVVGEFSSGKSTFLNALIGKDLLPHAVSETTAAVTYIHNVDETSEYINQIHIRFSDRKQTPIVLPLDENDASTLKEVLSTQSTSYAVASQVEQVDIYVRFLDLDEPIVLIDTPGTNGLAEKHRELLKKAVQQAHACICLFHLKGLGETDVKFMRSLMNSQTEFFFVLNHIDNLKVNEESPEKRIAKFRSEILHNLFMDNDVDIRTYGISALKALAARDRSITRLYSDSKEDILPEERGLFLKESGILDFEEDLMEYVRGGAIEKGFQSTVLLRIRECIKFITGDLHLRELAARSNPSVDVLERAIKQIDIVYTDYENRRDKAVEAELIELRESAHASAGESCKLQMETLLSSIQGKSYEDLLVLISERSIEEKLEAFWDEIKNRIQDYLSQGFSHIIEKESLEFSKKMNVLDFEHKQPLDTPPLPEFTMHSDTDSEERLIVLNAELLECKKKIEELGSADVLKSKVSAIDQAILSKHDEKIRAEKSYRSDLKNLGSRPAVSTRFEEKKLERKGLSKLFRWLLPKTKLVSVTDTSARDAFDGKLKSRKEKFSQEIEYYNKVLEQLKKEKASAEESLEQNNLWTERMHRIQELIDETKRRYDEDAELMKTEMRMRLFSSLKRLIEDALIVPEDLSNLPGLFFSDLLKGIDSNMQEAKQFVSEELSKRYHLIAEAAKQRLKDLMCEELKEEESPDNTIEVDDIERIKIIEKQIDDGTILISQSL